MRLRHVLLVILVSFSLHQAHAKLSQIATSGQLTASVDLWTLAASREKTLHVTSPRADAFTPVASGDLAKLLSASSVYVGAKLVRAPIETFTLHGFTGGKQIYWGTANFDPKKKIWTLDTQFNVAEEAEKLAFLPESMSGILTLAHNLKKQREVTKAVSDVYNDEIKKRAEAMADKALADFAVQAGKLETGYKGVPKVQEMAERFLKAAEDIGAPARGDIIAARESAIAVKIKPEVERTLAHIGTNTPLRWGEVFTLEDIYAPTYRELTALKQKDAVAQIAAAYAQKYNAFLAEEKFLQQFDEELAEIPVDIDAMEEMQELAALLDSQVERFPALSTFVEKVQLRMGEVIIGRCEALLQVIAEAGTSVDDIPGLLEESETEAEWFEEQEFDDIAAVIRLAALARCYELSESGYDTYAAKLKALTGEESAIAALREDLVFFESYKEEIADLARYEKLAQDRIAALLYEADAQLYQAIGITPAIKRTSLNVSGHIMSLAAFAKNISKQGHKVTGTRIGDSYTSDTASALGFLGWAKPAKSLQGISITTSEGVQVELVMTNAQSADVFAPDTIRQGEDEEDLLTSDWSALVVELGGLVPTGLADAKGVTDSDRFASDPDDPQKVVEYGVFADELNVELAIAASTAAIEMNPEQPRYLFHLGRALAIAGDTDAAMPFLIAAHEANYGAASFYIGTILFESTMQPGASLSVGSLRQASKYYAQAAALNHPLAKESLKSVNEMLALFTPPFDSRTFTNPNVLAAFYNDDLAWFSRQSQDNHKYLKFYCLGLRKIAADENAAFASSSVSNQIYAYVPDSVKRMGANPFGFGSNMSGDDLLKIMALSLESSGPMNAGNSDAQALMMYLNTDNAEVQRFFQNVLTYLKKYH